VSTTTLIAEATLIRALPNLLDSFGYLAHYFVWISIGVLVMDGPYGLHEPLLDEVLVLAPLFRRDQHGQWSIVSLDHHWLLLLAHYAQ
jgi:hypothetical protein